MKYIFICCFALLFSTDNSYAFKNAESRKYQNPKVALLLDSLNNAKNDSLRIHFLNELSWELRNLEPEKAILYANEGIKLAQKAGQRKKIAEFEKNLGVIFKIIADYNRSIEYFLKALNNYESERDSSGMASCYGNLGITYRHLKNYDMAAEYYERALEIFEKQNNKKGITSTWSNLGLLKEETGQHEQAVDYYNRALELCLKYQFIPGELSTRVNIGKLYLKQANYREAEEFFTRAFAIAELIGDKASQAVIHQNLSELNQHLKKKKKPVKRCLKVLNWQKNLKCNHC